jgi:hypothetical protein
VLARLVRILDEETIGRVMELESQEDVLETLIDKEAMVMAQMK